MKITLLSSYELSAYSIYQFYNNSPSGTIPPGKKYIPIIAHQVYDP